MEFEKHLFISYAHLDNQPLSAEHQGWISRFHQSLEAMLSMRLGRKAQIWRDAKLAGNDVFGDEILAQFPKTALFVSILTPRYIDSEWCAREVQEFCDAAGRTGGVVLDNKARVFKVIKTPVEREDRLPQIMRDMLGYPFFVFDDEQTPLELDPVAYGSEIASQYNQKVAKLAWDLARFVNRLESARRGEAPAASAGPEKPAVYLAQCSFDQRDTREALETELTLEGYRVLPEGRLPSDEAEFLAEVHRLIERCAVAVHFVGGAYGAVPDGPTEKSAVMLQNEIAIERSRATGLPRLIWIAPGTASPDARQQRFIESLLGEADSQYGADLIHADFETLKHAVHQTLKKLEEPPTGRPSTRGDASRLVYLICDERDRKDSLPVRKALAARGHEVEMPLFEGDAAALQHAHEDMLKQCDAVLLFYGAGDEAWRRAVRSQLRKSAGYREGRPLLADFTYLAAPPTAAKADLLDLDEVHVLDALDGSPPEDERLEPFLTLLEARP